MDYMRHSRSSRQLRTSLWEEVHNGRLPTDRARFAVADRGLLLRLSETTPDVRSAINDRATVSSVRGSVRSSIRVDVVSSEFPGHGHDVRNLLVDHRNILSNDRLDIARLM